MHRSSRIVCVGIVGLLAIKGGYPRGGVGRIGIFACVRAPMLTVHLLEPAINIQGDQLGDQHPPQKK